MGKKDEIKWATKLTAKGKRTGREKKSKQIRKKNQRNKKRSHFGLYTPARKTKKLLNYIQLAENYVHSVGNLFFSHFHANRPFKKANFVKNVFLSPKIG